MNNSRWWKAFFLFGTYRDFRQAQHQRPNHWQQSLRLSAEEKNIINECPFFSSASITLLLSLSFGKLEPFSIGLMSPLDFISGVDSLVVLVSALLLPSSSSSPWWPPWLCPCPSAAMVRSRTKKAMITTVAVNPFHTTVLSPCLRRDHLLKDGSKIIIMRLTQLRKRAVWGGWGSLPQGCLLPNSPTTEKTNVIFLSKGPAIWFGDLNCCFVRPRVFFKCIMCCPRDIGQPQNLNRSKLCQTFCSFGKRKVSRKFPVTEESWWPQFAHINGLLWPPQSFKYTRGVILFANTAQYAINDRQFQQKYHQHIITPPSCSNFTRPSLINSPFSTWSHL